MTRPRGASIPAGCELNTQNSYCAPKRVLLLPPNHQTAAGWPSGTFDDKDSYLATCLQPTLTAYTLESTSRLDLPRGMRVVPVRARKYYPNRAPRYEDSTPNRIQEVVA